MVRYEDIEYAFIDIHGILQSWAAGRGLIWETEGKIGPVRSILWDERDMRPQIFLNYINDKDVWIVHITLNCKNRNKNKSFHTSKEDLEKTLDEAYDLLLAFCNEH